MAKRTQHAREVVIAEGLRTPFSKYGGALRLVPSVVLGSHAVKRVVQRAGRDLACISAVYYGVTLPAEVALDGPSSGRAATLRAGLAAQTLSLTIDRGCCSSLTAVQLAAGALLAGEGNWMVAAGAENMGRATYLAPPDLRWGSKRGPLVFKDPLDHLGADIGGRPVAVDAGEVALEWGVDREQQDEWAAESHQKYFRAKAAGHYDDHIEAVEFPEYEAALDHDELPRSGTTPKVLGELKTVYGSPTVTAGNSPGLDTGAAAVLVARRSTLPAETVEPLATIEDWASVACAAREIAVAPALVAQKLCVKLGWDITALDVLEVNEAFAAVPLVTARCLAQGDSRRERELLSRTNPWGGAVAIGHPTGASGARLVLQLAKQLRLRGGGRGIAAICGALGQADAIALSVG